MLGIGSDSNSPLRSCLPPAHKRFPSVAFAICSHTDRWKHCLRKIRDGGWRMEGLGVVVGWRMEGGGVVGWRGSIEGYNNCYFSFFISHHTRHQDTSFLPSVSTSSILSSLNLCLNGGILPIMFLFIIYHLLFIYYFIMSFYHFIGF